MKEQILLILMIYLIQAAICALINAINSTRLPRSVTDFIKLIFLPYVLLNLKKIRKK